MSDKKFEVPDKYLAVFDGQKFYADEWCKKLLEAIDNYPFNAVANRIFEEESEDEK